MKFWPFSLKNINYIKSDEQHDQQHQKPKFMSMVISVIAAMFGVQTEQNRQRDFSQGNPLPYILIGVVFIILFVVALITIVSLVLPDPVS